MSKTLTKILEHDAESFGELNTAELNTAIESIKEFSDIGDSLCILSESIKDLNKVHSVLSTYKTIDLPSGARIKSIQEMITNLIEETSVATFDYDSYVDPFAELSASTELEEFVATTISQTLNEDEKQLSSGLEKLEMSKIPSDKIKKIDHSFDNPVSWVYGIEMRSGHYADIFVGQYKSGEYFIENDYDSAAQKFKDVKSLESVLKSYGYSN